MSGALTEAPAPISADHSSGDGVVTIPADQEVIPEAASEASAEGLGEAEMAKREFNRDWTPQQPPCWELKALKPMHQTVASLFAQGKKNVEIAQIVGITPEYVSMLIRQPIVKAYIAEMCEIVGTRMEALFHKSVDVIAQTLESGTEAGKLKAARLQMEATGRVGGRDNRSDLTNDRTARLEQLAERLIFLQSGVRQGRVFNEDGTEVR